MFKKVLLLVLITALLVSAAACGGKEEGKPQETKSEELSGTITTAGSTSVQPISEVLAEAFQEKHPKVTVNVQGGGSSAGTKAAMTGAADIGAASRKLKESEKSLHCFTIALDGIAIVVHPENPVSDLTLQQIQDIFAGKITNWKDVGGNDGAIVPVNREEGSGTRGAFTEIVMGEVPYVETAIVQPSTGAVKATVAGDRNAIGYISLASLSRDVKAVKVDGVEATAENIKKGTYKVARPFNYVTKEEPQGLVKAFIDFVLSEEGQKIIESEGLIRVK